jgi:hypothetical protein
LTSGKLHECKTKACEGHWNWHRLTWLADRSDRSDRFYIANLGLWIHRCNGSYHGGRGHKSLKSIQQRANMPWRCRDDNQGRQCQRMSPLQSFFILFPFLLKIVTSVVAVLPFDISDRCISDRCFWNF